MPRTCTICADDRRDAIDLALLTGSPATKIAALFFVSPDALQRHRAAHLPATLVRAREAREAVRARNLIRQVRALQARTLQALRRAENERDHRAIMAGVREARATFELLARVSASIQEPPPAASLASSEEWIAVRGALLRALAAHPEARADVLAALTSLRHAPEAEADEAEDEPGDANGEARFLGVPAHDA